MSTASRRLVGRENEVEAMLGLLDARDRLPAAAVLPGEAGIGKTTLWLAGIEAAAERGYRVFSARPSGAETQFSFVGLTDLIGGAADEFLPELPPLQRRALEAALLLGESEFEADERAVAAAFLGALRLLARESALCLAVDDLQWLDAASLTVLRHALARLERKPFAALLAVRGEVPAWVRHAFAEQRLERIEVGGLSVGATRELLRARLGATFPRPLLIRLWETSGGNPFFALELASALGRRGGTLAPGGELPIPAELDGLLHERVDALSAPALQVAGAVAALAQATADLVETALGACFEPGLADALQARVLELEGERLRFTHPLLAAAVVARQTPARRRSLHARLAAVVPFVEERARHLALASAGPDGEVATVVEEAAREAHARGAAAAAAELAELALRLTPAGDAEGVHRRTLAAAERLGGAGDNRRAIVLLEQARAAAPPGPARAAALVRLSLAVHGVRGAGEALPLARSALAEAQGDAGLEAEVHLRLADLMRFVEGGSVEQGLEHAELAVAAAGRAGDPALRCQALGRLGLMRFVTGRGVPHAEMEEALALERSLDGWPIREATWTVGHQLGWAGEDLERARAHLHAYRDAMRSRDSVDESHSLHWLTLLEWRAGNWDLAARYADDLLELGAQTGDEGLAPVLETGAIRVRAYRGEADARTRAEDALARAQELRISISQAHYLWLLGFLELSSGEAGAALEQLRRAWQILDELGYREPAHRFELADTLEALIAVGELDEAERRLAPWEERARALDRAWATAVLARCRALLRAARGDLDGSFAAFEEALADHGRSVYPFELARTLLALGIVQRRAKRRAAARTTLERALHGFEALGAPLWAAKAQAELARIGGRMASRGELTEAERRIAALVAEGRTNREVAAALFLTEHSVETALTRVYRKLDVRSRSELARLLASKS